MIGIIKCELIFSADTEKASRGDVIMQVLEELPWHPPLLDHHPEVDRRLKDLYFEFPESASYLTETHLKTLYHAATDTWLIITEAALGTLDIRLSNPIAERLKIACEAIVDAFLKVSAKKDFTKLRADFKVIQILDKEYSLPVYTGEVLHQGSIRSAIKEQRLEFLIGLISFTISIMLFYFTSPLAASTFKVALSDEWANWLNINAVQLGTATLVTAFISFAKIFLYALTCGRLNLYVGDLLHLLSVPTRGNLTSAYSGGREASFACFYECGTRPR